MVVNALEGLELEASLLNANYEPRATDEGPTGDPSNYPAIASSGTPCARLCGHSK